MLEFVTPMAFLLLPLPWLARRLLPATQQQIASIRVPFFSRLRMLDAEAPSMVSGSRPMLLSLALVWLCLVIACARPQWIGDAIELPATGRDLLLAVDISNSMNEPDMEIDGRRARRVDMVKYVVADFIERRRGDRIGLILFGSQAYLQAPLTFDVDTVKTFLMEAQLGFAGPSTAIGDALGLAVKRLRERPENHRVVILLTDGRNESGSVDPQQAASLAAQAGVRVYTIGVASRRYSRLIDGDAMQEIAQSTGGKFFHAEDQAELAQIYKHIEQLEAMEQQGKSFRPIKELYYWPLALALLLSTLVAIAPLLKKLSINNKATSEFAR
jgi:Ca-activated chloride channel homolog